MDKEAVEDLFDISSEQLACVNGAEPGMGLIRFGDKIVPLDNTIEKITIFISYLIPISMRWYWMKKVLDNTVHRIYNTDIRYTV